MRALPKRLKLENSLNKHSKGRKLKTKLKLTDGILKTDMNSPETRSLRQEGDPVQPIKATKKPKTHSLKQEETQCNQ